MSDYISCQQVTPAMSGLIKLVDTSGGKRLVVHSMGNVLIMPHGFGCVLFIACCSCFYMHYTYVKTLQVKIDYRIPRYLYHNETHMRYNHVERAYKTTHELLSRFLFYLMFSGLESPLLSSFAGFGWLLGRYMYHRHIFYGQPENRKYVWWQWIGYTFLQYGCLKWALKHLIW